MTYPIIAISTPIGIRALEYAEAKMGAEATPPIFASEATPITKRSSLKSLAKITINTPCTAITINPAKIYRGGFCEF